MMSNIYLPIEDTWKKKNQYIYSVPEVREPFFICFRHYSDIHSPVPPAAAGVPGALPHRLGVRTLRHQGSERVYRIRDRGRRGFRGKIRCVRGGRGQRRRGRRPRGGGRVIWSNGQGAGGMLEVVGAVYAPGTVMKIMYCYMCCVVLCTI